MNPILKRTLAGLTVGAAVVAAILVVPAGWFPPVCWVLTVLALMEVVQLTRLKAAERIRSGGGTLRVWAVGALLGVLVIAMFRTIPGIAFWHGNVMLLYILAIVKFSDVGGFAFGMSSAKLLKGGNHKLCPTISPGKSWEGLFGSVVFSSAVSCAFMPWTRFGFGKALAFGVAAALVGTLGDLVESKFKRWVGVKDSSTMKITAGMGGFLDMFDSLLFAPALLARFI